MKGASYFVVIVNFFLPADGSSPTYDINVYYVSMVSSLSYRFGVWILSDVNLLLRHEAVF